MSRVNLFGIECGEQSKLVFGARKRHIAARHGLVTRGNAISRLGDQDVVDLGSGGRRAGIGRALETHQRPGPEEQQAPHHQGQRDGESDERVLRGQQ
ncbi:hypothetical protein JTB14_000416 [Gonioctena quinquepunctata]|nr:hypothetical protein JTB14_000416 [Gonioctena quinquepunctata]